MNLIENFHSQSILEGIVNDISMTVGLSNDGDLGKIKLYEIINCYFLWKIQTDSTIKNQDDMATRGFHRDSTQFAYMPFDDMHGFYVDVEESWGKLRNLVGKYSDEELAECLLYLDYFDDDFFESTPESISRLVDEFLQIGNNDSVLEINAETCDYTIESKRNHAGATYTAMSEDYVGMIKGSIIADVLGFTDIVLTSEPDENIKYSKVFANNIIDPTNTRRLTDINSYIKEYWDEFPVEISNAWSTCAWAMLSAEDNGKAVALMNAAQLTVKQFEEVRKYMVSKGLIEGVIMLPDKMYEDTWVNPYLLILGKENKKVKFYDASIYYEKHRIRGKRINVFTDAIIRNIFKEFSSDKNTVEVSIEELGKNDYNLNPLRYLIKNSDTKNTICLGDVLKEVRRGMTLSASDMDALITNELSEKKCIVPSSVNGGIISTKLYYQGELKKPGKNEVNYGQILVSKTGNPFRAALAFENYLVAGNLYILSIDRSCLNPAYLSCFINSELGQKELMKYATVSTSPVISITNIQKIEIPVFEGKKQEEINRRCEEIIADLNKHYKLIADIKEEINSIFK